MKHLLFSCLFLFLTSPLLFAQNFNYNLSATTGTYTELTSATEVFAGELWDEEETTIPIGFSFTFMGSVFDTVIVSTEGVLSFDDDYSYVAAGFNTDLTSKTDINENPLSPLSYILSGTTGSRVLKIEYKNCGLYSGLDNEAANFQIWLYESGNAVEYHIGTMIINDTLGAYEENTGALIGMVNMTQSDTLVQSGIVLSGSPASPATINQGGDNWIYLMGTPALGTIYRFEPY